MRFCKYFCLFSLVVFTTTPARGEAGPWEWGDFSGKQSFGIQYTRSPTGKDADFLSFSRFDATQNADAKETRALLEVLPPEFQTDVQTLAIYYQELTASFIFENAIIDLNRFTDVNRTSGDIGDDVFVKKVQRSSRTISIGANAIPHINLGAGYANGTLTAVQIEPNGTETTNRIAFQYFNFFSTFYTALRLGNSKVYATFAYTIILPIPAPKELRGEFATQTSSLGIGITYFNPEGCKDRCKMEFMNSLRDTLIAP